MVSAPLREPLVLGVNVTLRVQLALAATLVPQVLVWEKSPLTVMLLIVRVALPVFVRVTLCALLLLPTACAGKVKEVGERLTTGALPVPVRLTVCVAGLALSVMVMEPLRDPAALGVNVTLRVQLALAARPEPQVLVWEKSPLTVMLLIVRVALPVFASVTL
jgi:negative regulator of sigma E activity